MLGQNGYCRKIHLRKSYHYIDDLGELLYISDGPKATVEIQFVPQANQKTEKNPLSFQRGPCQRSSSPRHPRSYTKVKKVDESDQLLLV